MPKIMNASTGSGPTMGKQLSDFGRCSHCSVANPNLDRAWASAGPTSRADGGKPRWWGAYICQSCGGVITASGLHSGEDYIGLQFYPAAKEAHQDLPEIARRFLQQAYETLHAPDAAAVMAGSAVDAMLKKHGLSDGSLYSPPCLLEDDCRTAPDTSQQFEPRCALEPFLVFPDTLVSHEAPFSPLQGASIMKHEYRAHVINRHGCVIGRVIIACDNDASAKSRVERLVAIHSLELWERERKIARFEAVR